MNQPHACFFAVIYGAADPAHIDILYVRSGGKVFDVGSAVDQGINGKSLKLLEGIGESNVAFYHHDTGAEKFVKAVGEIVYQQGFESLYGVALFAPDDAIGCATFAV
jgi:hypothetical protein